MKKLIGGLVVILLVSLVGLVAIVALSLAGDLSDYTEPSNETITRAEQSPSDVPDNLADGDICTLSYGEGIWDGEAGLCLEFILYPETPLPPTVVPIIPTLQPKNSDLDKLDYLANALIYMDSLLSITAEVTNNLTWLSDAVLLASTFEDLYAICAIGETEIILTISKLLALEPTDDLLPVDAMFTASLREFQTAMNKCSLGDFNSFEEHMEIGLGLLDRATTLMNLWEPEE